MLGDVDRDGLTAGVEESSHLDGRNKSGSGKMSGLRCRLYIGVPIGVPAGMKYVWEVKGLLYVMSSREMRGEREARL